MRLKQPSLRALDVGVLLYLAEHPDAPYAQVADDLALSTSTAHAARKRLMTSGLVHQVGRDHAKVARGPMLEFLQHAVQYVFPPVLHQKARGTPTGLHAAGVREFAEQHHLDSLLSIQSDVAYVWPSRAGQRTGVGIEPLVEGAPDLAGRDWRMYCWLSLVDVMRTGDVRSRDFARQAMAAMAHALP